MKETTKYILTIFLFTIIFSKVQGQISPPYNQVGATFVWSNSVSHCSNTTITVLQQVEDNVYLVQEKFTCSNLTITNNILYQYGDLALQIPFQSINRVGITTNETFTPAKIVTYYNVSVGTNLTQTFQTNLTNSIGNSTSTNTTQTIIVVGVANVTVPAGNFENCWVFESQTATSNFTTYWDNTLGPVKTNYSELLYYSLPAPPPSNNSTNSSTPTPSPSPTPTPTAPPSNNTSNSTTPSPSLTPTPTAPPSNNTSNSTTPTLSPTLTPTLSPTPTPSNNNTNSTPTATPTPDVPPPPPSNNTSNSTTPTVSPTIAPTVNSTAAPAPPSSTGGSDTAIIITVSVIGVIVLLVVIIAVAIVAFIIYRKRKQAKEEYLYSVINENFDNSIF